MSSLAFEGLMDNNMPALTISLLLLEMARRVSRLSLMPLRSIRLAPLAEQYCLTHSIPIFLALPFLLCPPVTGEGC